MRTNWKTGHQQSWRTKKLIQQSNTAYPKPANGILKMNRAASAGLGPLVADVGSSKKMKFDEILLVLILFGGFITAFFASFAAMLPCYQDAPKRWQIIVPGLVPGIVLFLSLTTGILVSGFGLGVMIAFAPVPIVTVLPILHLFTIHKKSESKRIKTTGTIISIILLISLIWSLIILVMMSDSGFMGASC